MHVKRSLLPDSSLSAACGPRRSNDSHFFPSQIMTASSKFPSQQCSSEERMRRRDSNRLSIWPWNNITMPIRWITKSSQFWISNHVRRMKGLRLQQSPEKIMPGKSWQLQVQINCVTVICYSQPDVLKTYGHFECVLSTIRFLNI